MNSLKHASLVALLVSCVTWSAAHAAGQWQERNFPPPNAGRLVFTILGDGNPACATYDGRNCLWNQPIGSIEFSRVKPLACGAQHRQLYGVTGFEDPKHWCNLALKSGTASPAPSATQAPPAQPAADTRRSTDWSGWGRSKGIEYRYRIWWTPSTGGPGRNVEAEYEVKNPSSRPWEGSVRTATCQDTLADSKPVSLAPGQTKSVTVFGPNCGTATNPAIRPAIGEPSKNY